MGFSIVTYSTTVPSGRVIVPRSTSTKPNRA